MGGLGKVLTGNDLSYHLNGSTLIYAIYEGNTVLEKRHDGDTISYYTIRCSHATTAPTPSITLHQVLVHTGFYKFTFLK